MIPQLKQVSVGLAAFVTGLALYSPFAVYADRNYVCYDLGYLGDYHFRDTNVSDLNDSGIAVGLSVFEGIPHAVLFNNGVVTDLYSLDAAVTFTSAAGVSQRGVISGNASVLIDGRWTPQAVLLEDGGFTILPLHELCDENCWAGWFSPNGRYAIGECHVIGAGDYEVLHDLLAGTVAALQPPTDFPDAKPEVKDVDNNATVIGRLNATGSSGGFVWFEGVMSEFQNTMGGEIAIPYAMNSKGTITGIAEVPAGCCHAMLVKDGIMTSIGEFDPIDINEREQVVGDYIEDLSVRHVVLYDQGELIELNGFFPSYWDMGPPIAINNYGWIVGSASDFSNRDLAWLLVPLYPKGDYDGDSDVDLHDFGHFQRCFAAEPYQGPEGGLHVGCSVFDFDDDVDLDLADYDAFQAAFTGAITSGW